MFLDWLIEHGFPPGRDALARHISRIEFASIRGRGALFPGVRETLEGLSKDGYVICLCTNGDRRYAEAVLSTCGILDLFAELQTNEVEGRAKSDLVRELLQRVPHERAYMIGDRRHDVKAGRANGCTVIGAAYGYGSPEELKAVDRCIGAFPDLVDCLS